MEINKESLILRKSGIVLQEEPDNWGFLYDPEKDYSYGMNAMSIFIWRYLETNPTFSKMIDTIKTRFINIPEEMETDIMILLTTWLEKDLITIQSPTTGSMP